ncbi:MAG: glycosyltransferase [Hyphomicrobiales bacterium]|nr:glycosyltransferase [Hyphomicrobiales bacterium]
MKGEDDSILLVLPVPFMRSQDGRLLFEKQACNGVRLWRENFGRVTIAAPLKPGIPPLGEWIAAPEISNVEYVLLPYTYHPVLFFRKLTETRRQLAGLIANSKYLQFAIGGLIGDWATFACLEAIRLKRPYCVWTDIVASETDRIRALSRGPVKHRIHAAVTYLPTRYLERYVIGKAALGLFHGNDTFSTYAKFNRMPKLVHNIHLGPEMVLSEQSLAAKNKGRAERPLQICYTGRVEPQKGPGDWVEVLQEVKRSGAKFKAVWVGDGSLLDRMRTRVRDLGLQAEVEFMGNVDHSSPVNNSIFTHEVA